MPSEAAGGAQQDLTIFGVAFSVQAEQREFVALRYGAGRAFVVAVDEEFHTRIQRAGDAREIAGDLPRAPCLPLRNRAAGDSDALGEVVLADTLFAPQGLDPGADIDGRVHDVSIYDVMENCTIGIFRGDRWL
jgi:hypothetical protein